jgi:hypothetical protein
LMAIFFVVVAVFVIPFSLIVRVLRV